MIIIYLILIRHFLKCRYVVYFYSYIYKQKWKKSAIKRLKSFILELCIIQFVLYFMYVDIYENFTFTMKICLPIQLLITGIEKPAGGQTIYMGMNFLNLTHHAAFPFDSALFVDVHSFTKWNIWDVSNSWVLTEFIYRKKFKTLLQCQLYKKVML